MLNAPGIFIIITLCSFAGLVMYAYYAECDPLKAGIVSDPNQLLPRFVMDIFVNAPGVPGLFVASLFSGALRYRVHVTWQRFYIMTSYAEVFQFRVIHAQLTRSGDVGRLL